MQWQCDAKTGEDALNAGQKACKTTCLSPGELQVGDHNKSATTLSYFVQGGIWVPGDSPMCYGTDHKSPEVSFLKEEIAALEKKLRKAQVYPTINHIRIRLSYLRW